MSQSFSCSTLVGTNITSIRNGRRVLNQLAFKAEAKRPVQLMGPNGAGKSTLLRICAGLLNASGGTLLIDGENGTKTPSLLHQACHFVGHLNGIKTALTVSQNVKLWQTLVAKTPDTDVLAGALDRLGLTKLEDTPAHYLSAGQRRRLALCRLLIAHRPVWLLDEPLTGLDDKNCRVVERVIAEHARQGGIAIIATHQHLDLPESIRLTLGKAG